MHIKVEQKHIDKAFEIFDGKGLFGKNSNTTKYDNMACNSHCPIALALKDMGFKDVQVNSLTAYIGGAASFKILNLPREATEFIDKFDKDGKVEPFEFEATTAE